MLDEWLEQREEERRRKPERRGHILVWYVLGPIAFAFALLRLWQLLTRRT